MSFLDKVKAGMAEAGSKAKTVVEVNRLKMVNMARQNDLNQAYQEIGKLVYEAKELEAGDVPHEQLEPHISRIRELKWEMEQNLQKIANLSDSKKCNECGADAPFDARECPKCGSKFEIIDLIDYETDRVEADRVMALEEKKPELPEGGIEPK